MVENWVGEDEEFDGEQEGGADVGELVAEVEEFVNEKKTKLERNDLVDEFKNRKEQPAEGKNSKGEGKNGAEILDAVVGKEVGGLVEEFSKVKETISEENRNEKKENFGKTEENNKVKDFEENLEEGFEKNQDSEKV